MEKKIKNNGHSVVRLFLKYLMQGGKKKKIKRRRETLLVHSARLTSHFVPNKFGRLHLTDAAEQTAQLILRHVLRQVIDYEVCFSIFWLISQVALKTVRDVISVLFNTKEKNIHLTIQSAF